MTTVRLTKSELRDQKYRLTQLKNYLPTLQLKKALLQTEVFSAVQELEISLGRVEEQRAFLERQRQLLGSSMEFDARLVRIRMVHKSYENVAGVELPKLDGVDFEPLTLGLFDTPAWTDSLVTHIQDFLLAIERSCVAREKVDSLREELREVTTRVNLFEKILIPRTEAIIKKIRVFLGDLQLSSIAQAKVAKAKILEREAEAKEEETSCEST